MSKNLLSAAVVIGTLRVNSDCLESKNHKYSEPAYSDMHTYKLWKSPLNYLITIKVCKMYFLNAKPCTVDPDQTASLELNVNFRTKLIIKSPLQLCDPVWGKVH